MPVTARLSKLFYERLGEDIANELVELFNTLDATYKADLRDLIEAHFARFDAKLAEQSARFDTKLAEMNARFDTKLAEMNARFDSRLAEMNARFDATLAEMNARFDSRFAEINARIDRSAAELKEFVERRLGEQTRWYYVAWAVQMTAIMTVLLRLFLR